MNKTILLSVIIFFWVNICQSQVRINEVMASNSNTIADEDGGFEDWIELYNSGESAVNLEGYGLSDNPGQPMKWIFPSISIPGDSFLIIWASGKDKTDPSGNLHTNFSISADGEEILLSTPDGELVDKMEAVPMPADVSYGRFPDGDGDWLYFNDPTPGEGNSDTGLSELLSPPTFSQPSGWYTGPFEVQLHSNDESSIILYTLDGSEPTMDNVGENGHEYPVNYFHHDEWAESENIPRKNQTYIYDGPIEIHELTETDNDLSDIITTYDTSFGISWKKPEEKVFKGQVLRAKVYQAGNESTSVTASYFVHPEGSNRYSLPTLSIVTGTENLFGYEKGIYVQGKTYFDNGGTETNYADYANFGGRGIEWERPVHAELFGQDGNLDFSQNLGMRIHGSGSRSRPMKGFRLYARNDYDDSNIMSFPFFPESLDKFGAPMDDYKHLLVRMGGDLMDVFTDAATHKIMEAAEVEVQRATPVIHFFNGEYWGIANIRDRLNDHFISLKYGIDTDNLIILEAPWGQGSADNVDAGDPEDIRLYRDLYNYVVDNDMSTPDHYQYFEEKVDVLSYIDYNIMFIYLANADWYGEKHFQYWRVKETSDLPYQDGKWRFMIWDFDATAYQGPEFDMLVNFIHPDGGGNDFASGDSQKTALLRNLMENEEFKQLFLNRFADHINSLFLPERMENFAQTVWDRIEPELEEHGKRWHYQWATPEKLERYIHFAHNRAPYQFQQLCEQIGASGTVTVEVDMEEKNAGIVQINTIDIAPSTAGIGTDPYPWQGTYFQDIPIELVAKANPGFKFDYWIIDNQRYEEEKVAVTASENLTVKAYFKESDDKYPQLIHYWLFDTNIENDVPLTTIESHYSNFATTGELEFQPAVSPYPPLSGTEGIMDRVNDPTILNYREQGNNGIIFQESDMRGIRARNPLRIFDNGEVREGAVILHASTEFHEEIQLSLATARTNNGPSVMIVDYSTEEDVSWTSDGLSETEIELAENFQLISLDFSLIEEANNNPHFKVRFRFEGNTVTSGSGNARFNNIAVEGIMSDELITSLPPDMEKRAALTNNLFPNPATGQIHLEFDPNSWAEVSSMEIVNMQGVTVKSMGQVQNQQVTIPLENLPAGNYILKIVTKNRLEILRFVKL